MGYGQKPLDYAINSVNAAFIDAALDAGADPAGSGDACRDAQAKVQLLLPRPRNKPGAGFRVDPGLQAPAAGLGAAR